MRVVPVLDLLGGEAVHAVRGERASYRRVAGRLGSGADPAALAAAMAEATGSRELYVADLDAIAGRAGHDATLGRLARRHAVILDGGVRSTAGLVRADAAGARSVVLGTETLPPGGVAALLGPPATPAPSAGRGPSASAGRGPDPLPTDAAAPRAAATPRVALSLDLDDGRLRSADPALAGLDARAALEALWDERIAEVLVLDLVRVGARAGPATDVVRAAAALLPGVPVLAGGGVRDLDDLRALHAAGAAGALVASGLHDGRLDAAGLRGFAAGSAP